MYTFNKQVVLFCEPKGKRLDYVGKQEDVQNLISPLDKSPNKIIVVLVSFANAGTVITFPLPKKPTTRCFTVIKWTR